jgi:cellobiose phosphorylase
MKEKISKLFQQIESILATKKQSDLPENTYFLDEKTILCLPREKGDSRYPYGYNGFYLWAYQSGYICANESSFTLFPFVEDGKQPYVAFFAGIQKQSGSYMPISLTGVYPQPCENVTRYTVFSPAAVYYLCAADDMRFAVCLAVNKQNSIEITLYADNLSDEPKNIYFSSYFNPLLRYMPVEDVESKWFKQSRVIDDGFLLTSINDLSRSSHITFYAVAKRLAQNAKAIHCVTAHADFAGSKNLPLNCAKPLFYGNFPRWTRSCSFTDTAVAGDIVHYIVQPQQSIEQYISFAVTSSLEMAEGLQKQVPSKQKFEQTILEKERQDIAKQMSEEMLRMQFEGFENGIKDNVLNYFLANVIRQVESCALAKTSSVSMLGIRDVFQQIESALIWNRQDCRAKILEALNFVGVNGRVPRQYSLPAAEKQIPLLDLRAFIDQGVWIIDTLYTYLAYTGDSSILQEDCGYYIYSANTTSPTTERGSVLEHLIKIVDYLVENIDPDTNCLKILYGDWNDALDGLGTTKDKTQEFGNGVSVMATLQLCKNLVEMTEILHNYSPNQQLEEKYRSVLLSLKCGLQQNAICTDSQGQRKILHGWGEDRSYFVGSFCDVDGKSRDSASVNAYWVISGAYDWDRSIKQDILQSYNRLDSKYGIKTFEPHFEAGTPGVGRIPNLPKGTAENGATYIHATMFCIWSLFLLNEPQLAWEQLYKVLPITHEHISTSPFVMPNSYVYNEEFNMDGESMNDWYTGSATVLIKILTRCIFGINVTQNRINISPAAFFPCKSAQISLKVRNCAITLCYFNKQNSKRQIIVNGEIIAQGEFSLGIDELPDSLRIEVHD